MSTNPEPAPAWEQIMGLSWTVLDEEEIQSSSQIFKNCLARV